MQALRLPLCLALLLLSALRSPLSAQVAIPPEDLTTGSLSSGVTLTVPTGASLTTSGTGSITGNVTASAVAVGNITGAGSGVLTFLATPSSANLASAVTGETGSGALVFGTGPTLSAPIIGTISNTGLLTLPTSTDTLVGRATTDTLTNKTLTAPIIATISNSGTLTLPTGPETLVGRATTDTLTNKSLSGASNTLSAIPNAALSNSTISIASVSTALGGSITLDTIDNGVSANGFLVRTGANTRAIRGLVGTSSQITVTNGNGGAGDPTLSLPTSVINVNSFTAATGTNLTLSGGTTASDAVKVANTTLATNATSGAFQVGLNAGFSGTAGGAIWFAGNLMISKAGAALRLTDSNITDPLYNTITVGASGQNEYAIGVAGPSDGPTQLKINGSTGIVTANRPVFALPSSAAALATNSTMTLELTSNTALTIKARGSDGTTRTVVLTLAP